MKTFTLYTDDDYSWLAVSLEDIFSVGLAPSNFSEASHTNIGYLFLEEEVDAEIFLREWRDLNGEPEIREVYQENSPIRKYPQLTPPEEVL